MAMMIAQADGEGNEQNQQMGPEKMDARVRQSTLGWCFAFQSCTGAHCPEPPLIMLFKQESN
jgi:hypothetical protein